MISGRGDARTPGGRCSEFDQGNRPDTNRSCHLFAVLDGDSRVVGSDPGIYTSQVATVNCNHMISKRVLIGLVLIITVAGCTGATGGDAPVDQTPDSSELVMHFDIDGLVDDPETEQLSEILDDSSFAGPDTDEVESEIEDELEIDPGDVDTALLFVEDLEASEQFGEDNFGLIVHGEFDNGAAIDAVREEEDLTETSYKDQTIYTVEDSTVRGDTVAFGILDDGQLVVGDEESVESAIDVAVDDADALSGDLRSEYDQTTADGLVAIVSEVPDGLVPEQGGPSGIDLSVFESVSVVSVEYSTSDGAVDLNSRFLTDSSSDAEDIQSVIDAGLVTFGDTGFQEADDEIDKVQTEQDGSVVSATYEGDLSDIEAVVDALS